MSRPVSILLTLSASLSVAYGAALVPVPTPELPSPVNGLEVNKGQAPSGILFLNRSAGMAFTATSILYSPLGASLSFVASNPNPTVSFSDPLPGVVNSYSGAEPAQWISGIPQYATANVTSTIYPGITAQFAISTMGASTLNLTLAAGVDPQAITFQIAQASQIVVNSDGSVTASVGEPAILFRPPALSYPAPSASQGAVSRTATFVLQSASTFGLAVPDRDSTQPLQISILLAPAPSPTTTPTTYLSAGLLWASDASGNLYYATTIQDAAGKPAPFSFGDAGCGINIEQPSPCLDVAIYKFSAAGTQEFATYLSGRTLDSPTFLGLTPTGALAVAGNTDSSDFPVSASAYQTAYAGPPAMGNASPGGGDYFAAILDPATGELKASTYLGGPNADALGTAAIGPDGSLYLLPNNPVVPFSAGLPTTNGALQTTCQGNPPIANPCANGYVAHLSPALDKLLYGTYLPGTVFETPQLFSDGSLFYAGEAGPGFPTTPGAYQPQNAGGQDGILARLDPTGNHLIFATYYGTPITDQIYDIAAAPDASVWASVTSFVQCCVTSTSTLIHLNATGTALINQAPIAVGEMVTNASGDLFALASGVFQTSPDALLSVSCGGNAYLELGPTGQQLFATYLPAGVGGFDGAAPDATPYLDTSLNTSSAIVPTGRVEVVQNQSTGPFVGCVLDAAAFSNAQVLTPGAIVTIFGSDLGPSPGVPYQLTNGQLPDSLGGVQVSIGGDPAPLLYSSADQLNLIVPYSLQPGNTPTNILVTSHGTPAGTLQASVVTQAITFFQNNGMALALNQDGSINSAQNPAQPGSIVALFGTGGGQTNPPSVAGEVTPLTLRPLQITPWITFVSGASITPEWAGAAPGLLSGVTQIDVKLPSALPVIQGVPAGMLPVSAGSYPAPYIAVVNN